MGRIFALLIFTGTLFGIAGCGKAQGPSAISAAATSPKNTAVFAADEQGRDAFAHALEKQFLNRGFDSHVRAWEQNGEATLCISFPLVLHSRPIVHQLLGSEPLQEQAPPLFQKLVLGFDSSPEEVGPSNGCYAASPEGMKPSVYTTPEGKKIKMPGQNPVVVTYVHTKDGWESQQN
jgi:hypothetical protein